MKAKLKMQKIVASVVVAAMSIALIPKITGTGTALAFTAATKNTDDTCLGTSGIAGPSAPGSGWNGSYVYFGHNGTGGDPIKFRVLAPSTTAYGGSTLFLDSNATLFSRSFDDDSNVWANSELRTYLNGTFLTGGSFTTLEQGAIAASTVSAHDLVVGTGAGQVTSWTQDAYGQYVALNGDKIFVLDAEEASNIVYGYSNTDYRCSDRVKGGSSASWWLRSANTNDSYGAGGVGDDGILYYGYDVSFDNYGVAPALNINQSSIIFSSLISGSFNTAGAEYKLTIANDNLAIAVPAGQEVTATETTITVPYEISGTDAGTANRASVLILDKAYGISGARILYYDALGGTFSNSAAATGTFELPAVLSIADWGTSYYVYILAEDVNDTYATDFASTPVAINAPAGGTISSAKIYLQNDISVVMFATFLEEPTSVSMVVTMNGNDISITGSKVEDKKYSFTFTGISPEYIADSFDAVMTYEVNGQTYTNTLDDYSIKKYCMTILGMSDSELGALLPGTATVEETRRLAVDILYYGAEAQNYMNHNTDNLATGELTSEQAYLASTYAAPTSNEGVVTTMLFGVKDNNYYWYSANAILDNAATLRLYFMAPNGIEGLTVEIDNVPYEIHQTSTTGKYYVEIAQMSAGEFGHVFNAIFKLNGTATGQTFSYSMNTYVSQVENNATFGSLAQRLYNYGMSAYEYAN